jgi:hypothetical protein
MADQNNERTWVGINNKGKGKTEKRAKRWRKVACPLL